MNEIRMNEHKNVEFFEKCLIVVIFTLLQHSSLIYRAQKITVTKRIIFLQSDYPVQIEEKLNNTKRLLQKSIFCSLYLIVTKNILQFSIVISIFLQFRRLLCFCIRKEWSYHFPKLFIHSQPCLSKWVSIELKFLGGF